MADFVQYIVHGSRPHINQYILDDTDWWPLQGHVVTLVVGGLRISCPCHEKPKKALCRPAIAKLVQTDNSAVL